MLSSGWLRKNWRIFLKIWQKINHLVKRDETASYDSRWRGRQRGELCANVDVRKQDAQVYEEPGLRTNARSLQFRRGLDPLDFFLIPAILPNPNHTWGWGPKKGNVCREIGPL